MMYAARLVILNSVMLTMLVACAGSSETAVRRPPGYASPVGVEHFEVLCGRSRVIVPYDSIDMYFNDDGTVKTHQEFCDDYRGDTLIRG